MNEPTGFGATPYDPTDDALIEASKKPMTRGGRTFSYAQGGTIIRQLCKVFPLGWRFEYDEPTFIPSTVDANGVPSRVGAWRCDGRLVISAWAICDTLRIVGVTDNLVIRDIGICEMPNASMVETALKGAFTDCMKRCARQLGDQFGNSLYDGGEKDELDTTPITAAQLSPAAPRPTPPSAPIPATHPAIAAAQQSGNPITCNYCARIITDEHVLQWCTDRRTITAADGTTRTDWACYACQQEQRKAGLGVGV